MTEHLKSFWRPLFVITVLIISAASALAAANLSVSKARDFDSNLQMEHLDKKEQNFTSTASSSRTDVDGHLVIYVVEPTGRWLDDGETLPKKDPKPFGNAVIGYAYDQDVYINETFDLTFDWDADAAGFGDIEEGNIKVVAAMFKTEAVATHFVVNGNDDLYFDAHHLIAAAEATPGNPGSDYSDEDYTHTVFIEESAATW